MPGLQKKMLVIAPAFAAATMLKQEETPVKRVVGLLEKMKAELTAEADKESEMYDQMVCWCETSEKEKTTAVAQAEATIADLQAEIEERAARFGTLETEIAALKKEIAENTATLAKAQAIREGEAGEFRDQEKFVVQTITNLKNAIAVLGKHQGMERGLKDPKGAASLAQLDGSEMSGLRVVLKDLVFKYELLEAEKASKEGTSLLAVSAKHTANGKDKVGSSLSQQLKAAMNSDHQDSLPLKFAEKVIEREAKKGGTNFLQASGKQPAFQSYASQSDGIFGILSQMLEEFEGQLKSIQGSEGTAGTDYVAMAAAKEEQIVAGKKKLDELEGSHADNVKALSDAKENLQLTTDQRSSDVEFLRNLKLTCNDLDAQWAARSKTRSEEIVAVSETITILTEDDNHEQLKAGGVASSFLQTSSETDTAMAVRRSKAAAALRKAARAPEFEGDDLLNAWRSRSKVSLNGPKAQLSTLAVAVQLDGFEKVKAMIDKLLEELKTQQKEEVDFKAYCIKEFDENEKASFNKNEEKEDLETKIAQLGALMEKLAAEIKEANEQIAATELDVKKASQGREEENAAFQQTVTDQRATQDILTKALQRLKDFYAKKLSGDGPADTKHAALGREVSGNAPGAGYAFLQVEGAHKQTPPVQFNDYKTNSGSSPVMNLIEQIIGDSKSLEGEAISGEYQAQADYEKMVKDSNALVSQLSEAVTSKTKASAQAKMEQGAAASGKQLAESELESLAQYESDLHNECDFVLKNFDIRQKARLQEMEAIQAAKGILSGAQ